MRVTLCQGETIIQHAHYEPRPPPPPRHLITVLRALSLPSAFVPLRPRPLLTFKKIIFLLNLLPVTLLDALLSS